MPDLSADAIVARLIWADDFNRTITSGSGWGPPYVDFKTGDYRATVGVDGSSGYLESLINPYYNIWSAAGVPLPISGMVKFDFWVPPASNENDFGYTISSANPDGTFEPTYVEIYSNDSTGTEWAADVYPGAWFPFTPERSTWYTMRAYFDGTLGGGGPVGAKVWKRSDPEPDEWGVQGTHLVYDSQYYPYWQSRIIVYGFTQTNERALIDNLQIWSTADRTITTSEFTAGAELVASPYGTTKTLDAIIKASVGTIEGSSDIPEYVSSSTLVGAYNYAYIPRPSGVVAGDTLIATIAFDALGSTVRKFVPNGTAWSEIWTGRAPNGDHGMSVWSRVASDNEPDTYRFDNTPVAGGDGVWVAAAIHRVRNQVNRVGIFTTVNSTVSTLHQTPNITTTGNGLLIVAAAGSVNCTWQPPSGMTERVDITNAGGYASLGVFTQAIATPGIREATSSASSARALIGLVLYPANVTFSASALIVANINNPLESVIKIRLNGVDITDDVFFTDAEFNSMASGSPGTCKFRIKDMNYGYDITVGQSLTLDVDNLRVWGGWVQSVSRQFFFPYTGAPKITDPSRHQTLGPCADVEPLAYVPRALVIEGIDYNILFNKRFCYDKSDPPNGELKSWPAGTYDDTQIKYLCANNLDLTDDGIDYQTKVERVGIPNPDNRGNPAGAGHSWGDAMRAISRYPGAIWYIDPDKHLVYTDVDTPNAQYRLRDVPTEPEDLGYRDMEILYNGSNLVNDAMIWGAGQGSSKIKFKRTRDTTSVSSHDLWQVGEFRNDLWRQASVDKRSNSFVYGSPQNKRGGKDDSISVSVTMFKPSFRVAEKVDFRSDVYGYADVLPVRRCRVTFPTNKSARFDYVLSHAIDEPWNTFEYWFPPIPVPRITIDAGSALPNCPTPSYPFQWDNGDGTFTTLGGNFIPIFTDDMSRAPGDQPDGGAYGKWMYYSNYSPHLTEYIPGILTDSTNSLNYCTPQVCHIALKYPTTADFQIIMAVDFKNQGWLHLGRTQDSYDILRLDSNGRCQLMGEEQPYPLTYPLWNIATQTNSPLAGQAFIRMVVYRDYFAAIKVWRMSDPEPPEWHYTVSMTTRDLSYASVGYGATGMAIQNIGIDWYGKLYGITVFSGDNADLYFDPSTTTTAPPGSYIQQTREVYGGTGWYKVWPMPGEGDPDNFYNPYFATPVAGSISTTTGTPTHEGSGAWGYWGPDYAPLVMSGAKQKVQGVYLSPYYNINPDYTFYTPPKKMAISGKISLALGRSRGIDNRGDYPTWHTLTAAIRVHNYAVGAQPYWANWYASGRIIGYVSAFGYKADQGAVTLPFYFEFPYGEYADPFLNQEGTLTWSVDLLDPYGKMRELDPRGGPFMLPNTCSWSVSTSEVQFWATYDAFGAIQVQPKYFCVPANSGDGGISDSRVCEDIPLDSTMLRRLYEDGEVWSVRLQRQYVPGTVTVTVDGQMTKPGLDFVESSPVDGLIVLLNSFLSSREVRVCYQPET
jgi:hypothetical protein